MQEKITIPLTGRRPVSIDDDEWPIVASAYGDDYDWTQGQDQARYDQARAQDQLERYYVRVRQHADGRAIVYAETISALDYGSLYGGVLLDPDDDMADAIETVGKECEIPSRVLRDCIADLPAEEL